MASVVREHETLSQPISPEHVARREARGWKAVAVTWERPAQDDETEPDTEPVPYGFRVSTDCRHLERDEEERQAMTTMLELIVADRPFSEIARELNVRGFRTRKGARWNQTAVFQMLPRLIEVAPEIYGTPEWLATKERLEPANA